MTWGHVTHNDANQHAGKGGAFKMNNVHFTMKAGSSVTTTMMGVMMKIFIKCMCLCHHHVYMYACMSCACRFLCFRFLNYIVVVEC